MKHRVPTKMKHRVPTKYPHKNLIRLGWAVSKIKDLLIKYR